ncbi:hypothetical protein [Actinomadura madurae]|uniref:hypothetical protein n=1 Tax=Actinomadura madurae TaxID=1993 RepID=UPI0020D2479E|nr:hypothetical protein [Actinomadura madurae]MCQ0019945.1 hypothetical protein [Actinomadura madurae]
MRAREATMEALVGALAPEESLVEQIIARVRAEIPSYAPVPHESLIASVERNLGLAARTISSGRAPTAEEISEAEVSTLERLQQGVPIEDIMRGFRVVLSRIQARLVAVAPFHGVEPADVVELSSLLWQLGDAFSARVAVVYRQHDIAAAVADQQRRTDWVMRVLTLGLPSTELHQGGGRLRPASRVAPVRAAGGPSRHRVAPGAAARDRAVRGTARHGRSRDPVG